VPPPFRNRERRKRRDGRKVRNSVAVAHHSSRPAVTSVTHREHDIINVTKPAGDQLGLNNDRSTFDRKPIVTLDLQVSFKNKACNHGSQMFKDRALQNCAKQLRCWERTDPAKAMQESSHI
jgi:hypothetical protein